MAEGKTGLTLGWALRTRRIELGLSQEALAAHASRFGEEIRQSDISRLERQRVTLPRRRRLEQLARALDLPLGELLARSGWAAAEAAFATPREPHPAPRASITSLPAPVARDALSERDLPWVRTPDLDALDVTVRANIAALQMARREAMANVDRATRAVRTSQSLLESLAGHHAAHGSGTSRAPARPTGEPLVDGGSK